MMNLRGRPNCNKNHRGLIKYIYIASLFHNISMWFSPFKIYLMCKVFKSASLRAGAKHSRHWVFLQPAHRTVQNTVCYIFLKTKLANIFFWNKSLFYKLLFARIWTHISIDRNELKTQLPRKSKCNCLCVIKRYCEKRKEQNKTYLSVGQHGSIPPTSQKYAGRWSGYAKLPLCEHECVNMCGVPCDG